MTSRIHREVITPTGTAGRRRHQPAPGGARSELRRCDRRSPSSRSPFLVRPLRSITRPRGHLFREPYSVTGTLPSVSACCPEGGHCARRQYPGKGKARTGSLGWLVTNAVTTRTVPTLLTVRSVANWYPFSAVNWHWRENATSSTLTAATCQVRNVNSVVTPSKGRGNANIVGELEDYSLAVYPMTNPVSGRRCSPKPAKLTHTDPHSSGPPLIASHQRIHQGLKGNRDHLPEYAARAVFKS